MAEDLCQRCFDLWGQKDKMVKIRLDTIRSYIHPVRVWTTFILCVSYKDNRGKALKINVSVRHVRTLRTIVCSAMS